MSVCDNSAILVSSSPFNPFVMDAYGRTRTTAFFLMESKRACTCFKSSGTGDVLGIEATVVKPPLAAAFVPVSIVSLCSPPGSRKWICKSINPDVNKFPLQSITFAFSRSEEHTSELQSRGHLVCRLLLEKKKKRNKEILKKNTIR